MLTQLCAYLFYMRFELVINITHFFIRFVDIKIRFKEQFENSYSSGNRIHKSSFVTILVLYQHCMAARLHTFEHYIVIYSMRLVITCVPLISPSIPSPLVDKTHGNDSVDNV